MGLFDILFGTTRATRPRPCPCGSGFDEGACQHRKIGGGSRGATTRDGRRTSGTRSGRGSTRRPSRSDRYIKPMGRGI